MKLSLSYDGLGIVSGFLCMIHCIGTPFLFIAKACTTTCCSEAPLWWKLIDYVFIVICFFAIWHTTKNKSFDWFKVSFWMSWVVLLFTLLNHSLHLISLPSNFIYIPSTIMIFLHIYNIKFGKPLTQCCDIQSN